MFVGLKELHLFGRVILVQVAVSLPSLNSLCFANLHKPPPRVHSKEFMHGLAQMLDQFLIATIADAERSLVFFLV